MSFQKETFLQFIEALNLTDPAHIDFQFSHHCRSAIEAKMRINRQKGRGGWHTQECSAELLRQLLVDHIAKGDPLDVMIIAGMLYARGEPTA